MASLDQCDYKAASEKGLGQHKRMKHRPSQLASAPTGSNSQITPEKIRISSSMASLVVPNSLSASSPVMEESCRNCEAPFLPGHHCENVERPWTCGAYLEAGLETCPKCHVKRPNLCDIFGHPLWFLSFDYPNTTKSKCQRTVDCKDLNSDLKAC